MYPTLDQLEEIRLWDASDLESPSRFLLPQCDELGVGHDVRRRPHVQDLVQGPRIIDRSHRVGSYVLFHHKHPCVRPSIQINTGQRGFTVARKRT